MCFLLELQVIAWNWVLQLFICIFNFIKLDLQLNCLVNFIGHIFIGLLLHSIKLLLLLFESILDLHICDLFDIWHFLRELLAQLFLDFFLLLLLFNGFIFELLQVAQYTIVTIKNVSQVVWLEQAAEIEWFHYLWVLEIELLVTR